MIYGIALILLMLQPAPDEVRPLLQCDPAWARLFTPERPRLGSYQVCAGDSPFSEDGFHLAPPERLEALDAFGAAGSYDRASLVQLFGGSRIAVIRGWRELPDRFESVTLLSPYPDATLSRVHPGTMIIRWTVDRSETVRRR